MRNSESLVEVKVDIGGNTCTLTAPAEIMFSEVWFALDLWRTKADPDLERVLGQILSGSGAF